MSYLICALKIATSAINLWVVPKSLIFTLSLIFRRENVHDRVYRNGLESIHVRGCDKPNELLHKETYDQVQGWKSALSHGYQNRRFRSNRRRTSTTPRHFLIFLGCTTNTNYFRLWTIVTRAERADLPQKWSFTVGGARMGVVRGLVAVGVAVNRDLCNMCANVGYNGRWPYRVSCSHCTRTPPWSSGSSQESGSAGRIARWSFLLVTANTCRDRLAPSGPRAEFRHFFCGFTLEKKLLMSDDKFFKSTEILGRDWTLHFAPSVVTATVAFLLESSSKQLANGKSVAR
jgi:hypothetical protein